MSFFISFEGLDGAGKSTQIGRLQNRLEAVGRQVVCTREPGGTTVGDILRRIVLDPAQNQLSERTEALLYAASRAQLVHQVIRPALAAGKIVLCDRYVDASIAYQGAGLGLGVQAVTDVNQFATQGLTPDLTFLFDLSVETSQTRVQQTRSESAPDRIERRGSEYFSRVREQFLQMADAHPERVMIVDAAGTVEQIEQEIWHQVANRLGI